MKKWSYFQMYTSTFIISALFICSWFCLMGKTFIAQGDGMLQHYPALVYYAKYLRSIIYGLILDHKIIIPSWDFSIGEGSDILETLHYYVIGDPFSFFSVLVPTRYVHLYYGAMIFLRLYLAGFAFSCLCFQTGQHNYYGILAGSMTYVFCYWALYNIIRHPYFLNPLLYMPLLLIGIEKILKNERPYIFILSVFLSAVSNFYFFYMLVMITIIYVIVRIVISYSNNLKQAGLLVLKIGLASVLGLLMSFVVFLPIFYAFLSDTRMDSNTAVHLFYPLSYYSSLPARFLTSDSSQYMCMGFAAPVLPAVFLLFYKKSQNKIIKILFLISIFITLFPVFGHILNGFSYVTNRWSWAFALLCSYILSAMWSSLMKLSRREFIFLIYASLSYFGICFMLEYSRKISVFTSIIWILFFLLLLIPLEKDFPFSIKRKQQLTLLVVLVSIFFNIFWVYSSEGDNHAAVAVEARQIKEHLNIDALAVKQAAAEETQDFWRYSGKGSLEYNGGLRTGLSSTLFYWSLSNPFAAQFKKEMDINEGKAYKYLGYDARTHLTALASVLYYVIPEGRSFPIPYGFNYINTIDVNNHYTQKAISSLKEELQAEELSDDQMKAVQNICSKNYSVYRNDIPLPLAYTYDNVLSEETWNSLTAAQKQEAILEAVFLKEYISLSDLHKSDLSLTSKKIDYTITTNGSGVSIQDHSFIVTSANASINLEFDGCADSETYFSIQNLSFLGKPQYDLYFGEEKDDPLKLYGKTFWKAKNIQVKNAIKKEKIFWTQPPNATLNLDASTGISNSLTYYTEEYSWYNDRHDFLVNMGYSDDKADKLTISFSEPGAYSFDSLEIICQPMENYVSKISALRKNTPENLTVGTDSVTGSISLESPQIICFSIPYSIGWKAKVDGEAAALYRANSMYIGLPLSKGEHVFSLEYSTPFLKEGAYISGAALLFFIIYVIIAERRKRYVKK